MRFDVNGLGHPIITTCGCSQSRGRAGRHRCPLVSVRLPPRGVVRPLATAQPLEGLACVQPHAVARAICLKALVSLAPSHHSPPLHWQGRSRSQRTHARARTRAGCCGRPAACLPACPDALQAITPAPRPTQPDPPRPLPLPRAPPRLSLLSPARPGCPLRCGRTGMTVAWTARTTGWCAPAPTSPPSLERLRRAGSTLSGESGRAG